jgi:hypothetical protein
MMATPKIYHKRGDSIDWTCTYKADGTNATNLTAYTIRSQVRNRQTNALIDALTVTKADQGAYPGRFTLSLSAASTALWPVAELIMDIEYTISGAVKSTETVIIQVIADVTI